jgi:hypothetical protein
MHKYTGGARSARQSAPARAPDVVKPIEATSASEGAGEAPWRDTAFLSLQRAAQVLGISVASLYRLEQTGEVKFRRLAGRTLVKTDGVIALESADEPWTASQAGSAARVKRAELAANGWKEVAP